MELLVILETVLTNKSKPYYNCKASLKRYDYYFGNRYAKAIYRARLSVAPHMIHKIHRLIKTVLTPPQDETSPEGRIHNRHRRAALSSLALIIARVLNIATGLLTVPITLKYLGDDLFGVWMAITGVVAYMSFTDFGLGVGLQNTLIECYGNDDYEQPRKLVGNAIFMLSGIAVLLALFTFFIVPYFPVDRIVNCKNSENASQILPTLQAIAYAFAFGLPMGLIQYVCNAYQRGYWGYSLLAIGRLLGFVFIVVAVLCKLPLWFLAAGFVGAPFLVMAFGWIILFWKVPFLRPWPFCLAKNVAQKMLNIGGCILVIRICYQIMYGSIAFFISYSFNAADAAPFSVTQRLLGAAGIFTMSVMVSLWGAYGEAAQRGDWVWIRLTLKRSVLFITAVFLPVTLLLVLAGPWIIRIWTGEPGVVPSLSMLLACAALSVTMAYNGSLITLLNGLNRVGWRAFYNAIWAIITLMAIFVWPGAIDPAGIVWLVVVFGAIPLNICYIMDVWLVLKKSRSVSPVT